MHTRRYRGDTPTDRVHTHPPHEGPKSLSLLGSDSADNTSGYEQVGFLSNFIGGEGDSTALAADGVRTRRWSRVKRSTGWWFPSDRLPHDHSRWWRAPERGASGIPLHHISAHGQLDLDVVDLGDLRRDRVHVSSVVISHSVRHPRDRPFRSPNRRQDRARPAAAHHAPCLRPSGPLRWCPKALFAEANPLVLLANIST